MMKLLASCQAWGSPAFEAVFKQELIAQHATHELPLHAAMTQGSHVADSALSVRVLQATATDTHLHVQIGVFFASIIAGCSCADDPTPVDELPEYAEMAVRVERDSGRAAVSLLAD